MEFVFLSFLQEILLRGEDVLIDDISVYLPLSISLDDSNSLYVHKAGTQTVSRETYHCTKTSLTQCCIISMMLYLKLGWSATLTNIPIIQQTDTAIDQN